MFFHLCTAVNSQQVAAMLAQVSRMLADIINCFAVAATNCAPEFAAIAWSKQAGQGRANSRAYQQ